MTDPIAERYNKDKATGAVSPLTIKFIAVGCTLLFTVINLFGVNHSGGFQVIMVVGLLLSLIIYIGAGLRVLLAERTRKAAV